MSTLRIALLDVAVPQAARLQRLVDFPIEYVTPRDALQDVDAVVALRFGKDEGFRYRMRLLHLPGAGADAVDRAALPAGCVVCNVFEHEVPVSEFVMTAVLGHALRYGDMLRSFDADHWAASFASRRPHGEVHGKTLGLIGYGHIGRAVASRAKAFGLEVLAISQSGHAPGADWAATPKDLATLLERADFVVIACPLTPATRGLLGAAELALMKPGAVLVNIGRAQVVDEEALYRSLESGRLGGATLDVWYEYPTAANPEPRPSRFPFHELPNVHCTAHSSAWTEGLFERRFRVVAQNLGRLARNEPLENVILRIP